MPMYISARLLVSFSINCSANDTRRSPARRTLNSRPSGNFAKDAVYPDLASISSSSVRVEGDISSSSSICIMLSIWSTKDSVAVVDSLAMEEVVLEEKVGVVVMEEVGVVDSLAMEAVVMEEEVGVMPMVGVDAVVPITLQNAGLHLE